MKSAVMLFSVAAACLPSAPAVAQQSDFHLTYHVERTPAGRLSIKNCGRIVAQAARQAGLSAGTQRFPGQLVLVKGGRRGAGAFVVQCIAVGNTTVSVVQGIDYANRKGALGGFADRAFASIKRGVR